MYEVEIHTGSVSKAGTDSTITLTLHGTRGSSIPVPLNSLISGNAFERGSRDIVKLDGAALGGADLGDLVEIELHNAMDYGFGGGWFLDRVEVRRLLPSQSWQFPCYQWFARDEGDKKVRRRLKPGPLVARPIHVIGHMCNGPEFVDEDLKAGANAIELDVQAFRHDGGVKLCAHHGGAAKLIPMLYQRAKKWTSLDILLRHLALKIKNLRIIIFDCKPSHKVPPGEYGQALANLILTIS